MAANPATERIRAFAFAEGFDAVGFAPASISDSQKADLAQFLAAGHQGDMGWMAEKADRRGDPQALWPEAKSVILLAANYAPAEDPLAGLGQKDRAVISVYARNKDYHDILKKRAKRIARRLADSEKAQVKVFVDTAPVMEKPLAQAAGIGWQGKHTNLVSRRFGSWLFLAEIFTDLDLGTDPPVANSCGLCKRCIDICPTRAIVAPYRLDARRCISYLTIEHKGPIPRALRPLMGNRIYGCDDCLAVCPWNRFATPSPHPEFSPRREMNGPALAELAALDDPAFRRLFAGSPVKRIGRDRFLRNVLIAMGNSGDATLIPAAEARLADAAPLVRATAVWALSRLLPAETFDALARRSAPAEADSEVGAEWTAGAL